MDSEIRELDFWEMTPGEVIRQIESRNRIEKIRAQEKASYDYILAQLITKGVSITLGSKEEFPKIIEAYPSLFKDVQKEKIQKQKDDLSAFRFRQFAQSYNSNFKNKEVPKEINE